jgi:DNA (cytosine-5)-methyltransferase 1
MERKPRLNDLTGGPGSDNQLASVSGPTSTVFTFYEFFSGGGMARAGLGPRWSCAFANEIDPKKAACYAANWGSRGLAVEDIRNIKSADLPGSADLAWASFPCQDLSLAGSGAGLTGQRSGTFWAFWGLMEALALESRAPGLVVLENVCGTLSSHDGRDFESIASALSARYRFGALVIDAAPFLPQSRPRLFVVAAKEGLGIPSVLRTGAPDSRWHPRALIKAYAKLPNSTASRWIWWSLPSPAGRESVFSDLIEEEPEGVSWHPVHETEKLVSMMSGANLAKLRLAQRAGRRMVGAIYKRTRHDDAGKKVQRAEIRFDNVAGCLRTPAGGSSRQSILIVEGDRMRSRLLSPREAARLMGLPDNYVLPKNYNEAYHLAGDGVAVPVVKHLARHLFEPLLHGTGWIANVAFVGLAAD